jgi:hypothetical protein
MDVLVLAFLGGAASFGQYGEVAVDSSGGLGVSLMTVLGEDAYGAGHCRFRSFMCVMLV